MNNSSLSLSAFLIGLCVVCAGGARAEGAVFVAGTAPWERPVQAPTITEVHHGAEWFQRALTGVTPPYPASLRFLEDQGAWHTPFNQPGTPGPYDIRGWFELTKME